MILNLLWKELHVVIRVNPTVVFSKVVNRYLRNQGFDSAEFVYNGDELDVHKTVSQLGLTPGSDIYVKNAIITDISNHNTLEVKIYDSKANGYRSMGRRWYSIKSGRVMCKSVISVLQSDLGVSRLIHIVNGSIVVDENQYIDSRSSIVAVMG